MGITLRLSYEHSRAGFMLDAQLSHGDSKPTLVGEDCDTLRQAIFRTM